MTSRAASFAAVFAGMFPAHMFADHIVQANSDAENKGRRDHTGQIACARHVATYTAVQIAALAGLNKALGLGLTWRGIAAGQVVSAATHYWADRRYTLRAAAERIGKPASYLDHGGMYHIDQSLHISCLAVGALLTAVIR